MFNSIEIDHETFPLERKKKPAISHWVFSLKIQSTLNLNLSSNRFSSFLSKQFENQKKIFVYSSTVKDIDSFSNRTNCWRRAKERESVLNWRVKGFDCCLMKWDIRLFVFFDSSFDEMSDRRILDALWPLFFVHSIFISWLRRGNWRRGRTLIEISFCRSSSTILVRFESNLFDGNGC